MLKGFKSKIGSQAANSKGADPFGNSPLTAFEKGKREWFERMGSPVVERDRYFVMAAIFGIAFIGIVLTLMGMMPLSRAVPYTVQVDKITGEASAVRTAAQIYKPGNPEKQYFLTRWVRQLMELDANTTSKALTEVFEGTRGKATDEFTDFIGKTKPLVRIKTEQGLVRNVEVKSYSPINDQSVMIRFATEERAMGQKTVRRNYVITIHIAIDPPATESAIMKNPLGLFVTHFAINEDNS